NICGLVQLRDSAPQELLYSGRYWYRSGVTKTMRDALRDITQSIESKIDLGVGDVVLDIGSNDGTLLRSYEAKGIITVGIEPATNLQEEGEKGINRLMHEFWDAESYMTQMGTRAKVITAIGMFYDLEDPNKFIADVATVLRDDGIFVAQLMCLKNMLCLKISQIRLTRAPLFNS
ncbi:MAG: methyltransferase domain-containing protein, partial [Nitrosopumilus sp.]